MDIINLKREDVRKAAEVSAAAFYDYPMFAFYFPDPQRRRRYLPWYFGNVLRCARRYGEVYTTRNVSGVIFTLPPGHTRLSTWEYVHNGFLATPLILGWRNYQRSMACERFVADTQEKLLGNRPHTYLWGLAVDPRQKATGVGRALLEPVLAKADGGKVPVYLETHAEVNVAYYQKHGFELIESTTIPKYALPIWCMLREPGQGLT